MNVKGLRAVQDLCCQQKVAATGGRKQTRPKKDAL